MNWAERFLRRKRLECDLDKEVSDHIERQIADYRGAGFPEQEARRQALLIFNQTSIKEAVRDQWGAAELDRLWQDIRFAIRSFRKNPNFTLAITLSLALGLGGTCAFFSVVYAVVLHPMYKDASHIVVPTFSDPDSGARRPVFWYTKADYALIDRPLDNFESVIMTSSSSAVTGAPELRNVKVLKVSPNYFEFFNTPATLGRPFALADIPQPKSPPPLAVIGHALWKKQFNGSPSVIGRDLKLNSNTYKIIGVMPKAFTWFDTDVFIPEPITPDEKQYVEIYFKLRHEGSIKAATAELQAVSESIARANPQQHPKLPFRMHAELFQDWILGKLPGQLIILLAAVSMLLLIACGNVSILLLARNEARMQEIGMRFALGASKGRIVRQLLTETLLVSLTGCAISVLFAWLGLPALLAALPPTAVPREAAVGLNWPVLWFAIVVSLISGICAGLTPALRLTQNDLQAGIKSGNRTTSHGRFPISTQTLLITTEIALSAMLLIGCIVAIRKLVDVSHTGLGYNPHNVAVLSVSRSGQRKSSWGERCAYVERLRQVIAEVPGVQSVAATFDAIPPTIDLDSTIKVPGGFDTNSTRVRIGLIGADYFKTLQTPLIVGKVFSQIEIERGAQVAIINETLARMLMNRGKTPVGTQLQLAGIKSDQDAAPPNHTSEFQVIGVVATIENENLEQFAAPAVYLPYTHLLDQDMTFLVRTYQDPQLLEHTFQKRLHKLVEANDPVAEFDTLDHTLVLSSLSDAKSDATLFSMFAFVAISLASFGLYSTVSFGVAQRKKEFAIRRALGAQSVHVVSILLRWMAGVTTCGVLVGILGTFAFGRVLAYYEQGWRTNDPAILVLVSLLLISVSTIAIAPAVVRALAIAPGSVLREQ